MTANTDLSNKKANRYDQLWDLDFDPNVSVVDLILNVGFDNDYLKPISGK
jgi:cytidylate kinase